MCNREYKVLDFGGNPLKIFHDIENGYPSEILLSPSRYYFNSNDEVIYVPLKTAKINMTIDSWGEVTKCLCSGCRNKVHPLDKYCSQCGAKLREGDIETAVYPVFWESIDEEDDDTNG